MEINSFDLYAVFLMYFSFQAAGTSLTRTETKGTFSRILTFLKFLSGLDEILSCATINTLPIVCSLWLDTFIVCQQ